MQHKMNSLCILRCIILLLTSAFAVVSAGCIANTQYVQIQFTGTVQLTLQEVQVWVGTTNAALTGTATMSSQSSTFAASRCIDNDPSSGSTTYCQTLSEATPWWKVDLGSEQCVDRIVVFNRQADDAFVVMSKMAGATVTFLSSGFVVQRTFTAAGENIEVFQDGSMSTTARKVKIKQSRSKAINLREIMVINSAGTNVALSKTVTESSVANSNPGSECVDGVTTSGSSTLLCQTALGYEEYVEIDLAADTVVDRVVIYNRMDASVDSIKRCSILLIDANGQIVNVQPATKDTVSTYHFGSGAFCGFRYIRIEQGQNNAIELIEVMAMLNGVNVALSKTASQSADNSVYVASRAVDGRALPCYLYGDCTSATTSSWDSWWEVDLGSDTCIDYVFVQQRDDAQRTKMDLAALLLLDVNRVPLRTAQFHPVIAESQSQFIIKPGVDTAQTTTGCQNGRYVRIERLTNENVGLQEIAVYAGIMNVALGKSVTWNAACACGGNDAAAVTDGAWEDLKYAQTSATATSWVQVDLGATYCVDRILVIGEKFVPAHINNCQVKLQDASFVDVQTWTTNSDLFQMFHVGTQATSARHVMFQIGKSSYLHCREVQVMSGGSNVALSKPTEAQGTVSSAAPSVCVDGAVTHVSDAVVNWGSILGKNVYWAVDLQATYVIDGIFYYNRMDVNTRVDGGGMLMLDEYFNPVRVWPMNSNQIQSFYPTPLTSACGVKYVKVAVGGNSYVDMREVEVWSNGVNVALAGSASQNSDFNANFVASIGNDNSWNDQTGAADDLFTTITAGGFNDYWMVDLGGSKCIDYVNLHNRVNWNTHIDGSSLLLLDSNQLPVQERILTAERTQPFFFNTTYIPVPSGCVNIRYAYVETTTAHYLLMVEVEVWAGHVNVAIKKTATQSTNIDTASGCVDGDHLDEFAGSYCQTNTGLGEWMQFDLGQEYCVSHVMIYGHKGFLTTRLDNSILKVKDGSNAVVQTWSLNSDAVQAFFLGTPVNSIRYVRVEQTQNDYLNFRELQAWQGGTNVAAGKTAVQYSQFGAQVPGYCVDGDLTHDNHCCTSNTRLAWWEVDLGQEYELNSIVVYNRRANEWPARLPNAHIVLFDKNRVPQYVYKYTGLVAQMFYVKNASNCNLRYARIEAQNQINTFQEVEVFSGGQNIAPSGTATQDSTGTGAATVCNDGVRGPLAPYATHTCRTYQAGVYDAWWELDFGSNYCIDYVEFFNRVDAETAFADGSILFLMDSARTPIQAQRLTAKFRQPMLVNSSYKVVNSGCVWARYFRAERTTSEALTFQEVEVYTGHQNVALLGTATSSSAVTQGPAFCIDGSTWQTSYCHTSTSSSEWFQIDLGEEFCVTHVVIYAYDSAEYRMNGVDFKLQDGSTSTVKQWSGKGQAVQVLHVADRSNMARYVRVELNNVNLLNMREVEVVSGGVNVALSKTATQLSDWNANYPASNCVDGTKDWVAGEYECCITASGTNNWWQVDLGQEYPIDTVSIFNRQQNSYTFTDKACLVILDKFHSPLQAEVLTDADIQTFNFTDKIFCGVRHLRVENSQNQWLAMEEVRAFSEGVNVAEGKTATQDGSYPWGGQAASDSEPQNCVDGRVYERGTPWFACHTATQSYNAYWEVDFGSDTCIDYVEISAFSAAPSYIDRASVILLDSSRNVLQTFPLINKIRQGFFPNSSYNPQTDGCVNAQFLKIQRTTAEYLVFQEIEMYAGPVNVALGKAVTQSSTFGGTAPESCVDGNLRINSLCHTNLGSAEWTLVNLGQEYCISHVVLYGQDGVATRLPNNLVKLQDAATTEVRAWSVTTDDMIQIFRVGSAISHSARFATIQMSTATYLHVSDLFVDSFGENIALGKYSHTYAYATLTAHLGNDGDLETHSHTNADDASWYEVDFNASYPIHSIAEYNLHCSCDPVPTIARINTAILVLSDENYVPIQTFRLNGDKIHVFHPNQSISDPTLPECGIRYIQVRRDDANVLQMDEVQVISSTGTNLAPAGTATQRDTWVDATGSFVPSNCNDGDTNAGDGAAVATQTCITTSNWYAWWQLDLGSTYCIDRVIIYNRGDLNSALLNNAYITLNSEGNVPLRVFRANSDQVQLFRVANNYILPNINTVQVLHRGSKTVHMREVMVFRDAMNMALSGTATQSSTKSSPNADGSGPEICKDGSTAIISNDAVCQTQAGYNQWWKIVLNGPQCIDKIDVYNRADANSAELTGASLLVFTEFDVFPAKVWTLNANALQQIVTGSVGCTPSQSETLRATQSISNPLTDSLSISPSSAATPTASLRSSNTLTISSLLTASATSSSSTSASATISVTPPPTLTRSGTPTTTLTSSLPLTLSLPLTGSATLPATATASVSSSITSMLSRTVSLPVTPTQGTVSDSITATISQSETKSLDFYCGGLLPEKCARQVGLCDVSESGICFFSNCSALTSNGVCLTHGCQWIASGLCVKPRECRDYRDPDGCESSISCRWSDVDKFCKVDRTPCHTLKTQAVCQGAYCAWNSLTDPRCFRPFRSSGLCLMVSDELTCEAQKCLWISALYRCEPWDIKCEDVTPRPDICPLIDRCIYFEQQASCVSLDNIPPGAIAGVQHSAVVFPGQKFDVQFIGIPLEIKALVGVLAAGDVTSCPVGLDFVRNMNYIFEINEDYDEQRKASTVRYAVIHVKGNYSFCIQYNETFSVGPLSRLQVDTPTPGITSCDATPAEPFSGEQFSVAIRGFGLDPLARVTFVANETQCPPFNTSLYLPILQYSSDVSMTSFVYSGKAELLMCYVNRGGIPVSSPTLINIQGIPPWYDLQLLKELSLSKAEFEGSHALEWNSNFCIGLQDLQRTGGIFAHPKTMAIQFGDGVGAYPRNTVCAALIKPFDIPEVASNVNALHLFVRYMSLELEDEIRLFVPSNNAVMQECSFRERELCEKAYCHWNDATGQCSMQASSYIEGCPRNIKGYTMERVLTYSVHQLSAKYQASLPLPLAGAIVLICSMDSVKSGLGVSLTYKTQETYCKNDCKDERGTSNGVCRQSLVSGGYQCRCNTGFQGDDCSRPTACRGVRGLATTVKAAQGEETVEVTKEACGTIYIVDPSLGSFAQNNMKRYGVGAAIKSLSLSEGGDCSTNYVMIREESYTGKLIAKLCPTDNVPHGGEAFRFLIETAASFYIEHVTDSSIDGNFLLEYTAVSLVCPGTSGPTGVPETPEEICDGKGDCTARDYQQSQTLSTTAYLCACTLPWGASIAGATCNTCGFGYMKSTFPECRDATVCARNCSGNGLCLPGKAGCLCDTGYYGLDCTLMDDGERLGDLKPELRQRIPLNGGDAGNVIQSGSVDRTLMDCSLAASTIPCRQDKRQVGRRFAKKENSVWDSVENGGFSFLRRRQSSNGSNVNATANDTVIVEQGMSLNLLATEDTYPQFIRTDNVSESRDVFGTFTISGWVKVTSLTKGFLFAKTDSAFYSDGQSPVLERAVIDIEDRDIPLHKLRLFQEKLNVYIAIFMNGPRKRVDLLVTRADMRDDVNMTHRKEDWLYVRHFRLGKKAGVLFDGSWHFMVLELYETDTRNEGLVFVDGYTSIVDPGFVQCVPFLPPLLPLQDIQSEDKRVVVSYAGTSIWWGYRLQGSVDELHVYSKPLSQRTVVDIAGDDFLGVLMLPTAALMALIFLGLLFLVIAFLLYSVWWQDQWEPFYVPPEEEKEVDDQVRQEKEKAEVDTAGEQEEVTKEVVIVNEGSMIESNPFTTSAVVNFDGAGPNDQAADMIPMHHTTADDLSLSGPSVKNPSLKSPSAKSLHLSAISVGDRMGPNVPEEEEHQQDEDLSDDQGSFFDTKNEMINLQREIQQGLKYLKEDASTEKDVEQKITILEDIRRHQQDVIKYLKEGKVNDAHLNLLIDIQDLMAEEIKKQAMKKKAKTSGGIMGLITSISTSFTNSGGKENVPFIITGTLDCFQILAGMSISMGFPNDWKNIWGGWTFLWSLEFLEAFNVPFALLFYILFAIAVLCMIILFVTHLCSKRLKHDEVVENLEVIHEGLKEAIAADEKYSFPGKWKATLIMGISSILTVLYMPLTRQALKAIVCHRSIMCMYDCYIDKEHQLLVVLGIVVLVVVTLGTPLFYVFTVRSTMIQYHYFIGSFDEELQAKYWSTYTYVMLAISPFSSLYDRFRHPFAYFEVFVMVFKVLMISFLMVLTPESLSQTAAVMVLQGLFLWFVAGFKPTIAPLGNKVMAIIHSWLVCMLIFQIAFMLKPENKHYGRVMVAFTFFLIFAIVFLIVKALFFTPPKVFPRRGEQEEPQTAEEKKKKGEKSGASMRKKKKEGLFVVDQDEGQSPAVNEPACIVDVKNEEAEEVEEIERQKKAAEEAEQQKKVAEDSERQKKAAGETERQEKAAEEAERQKKAAEEAAISLFPEESQQEEAQKRREGLLKTINVCETLQTAQDIEVAKSELQQEMGNLNKRLESNAEALKGLKPRDLNEVKQFKSPPKRVQLVLEATMLVLGEDNLSWNYAKQYMVKTDIGKELYKVQKLKSSVMAKLSEEYLSKPDFQPDAVREANQACYPLCRYIIALFEFNAGLQDRIPVLQENLTTLEVKFTSQLEALTTDEQDAVVSKLNPPIN